MAEVMKHASTFILPHLPDNNRSFALVVLNHQLPVFTPLLWEHASLRVCADGGANRVYDEMPKLLFQEDPLDVRSRYKPDAIKGDMDSIRPEVRKFYNDLGTEIVDESHDQDTTDLHKCVSYVRNCTPDSVKPSLSILVAGALGGRFDHEIGNINVLHRFSDTRSSVEGPHCGLFPVGRPSLCTTTTGLQWDLTESEMGFGGLISTSNIVREEKITVQSDSDLIWTISIRKSH
ncbi:unnamed protein product [Victoria cruziana]